jgi:hypothetical protein
MNLSVTLWIYNFVLNQWDSLIWEFLWSGLLVKTAPSNQTLQGVKHLVDRRYIWTNHLCKDNKGCALVATKTSNDYSKNNNTTTTTLNVCMPCIPTTIHHKGLPISSLHVPECSFHVGCNWDLANVNMTRGSLWGEIIIRVIIGGPIVGTSNPANILPIRVTH